MRSAPVAADSPSADSLSDSPTKSSDESSSDRSAESGSSLLSNTRVLVIGRLIGAGLAWFGTVLIVRSLTKAEFGEFSFVFALLGLVSLVSDLGLGRIALAGVMDEDSDRGRFAANYIMLRTCLGVLAVALALAYVVISDQSSNIRWATLIGCFVVLISTPTGAYEVAYQAHDNWTPVAIASIIAQLSATALVVAFVFSGGTMIWFVVPAVLREAVELALKWRGAHRLVPFRYELDFSLWWPMLKEAVPLSIGTLVAIAYYRIDSLMLQEFIGPEAVATYAVGYKFADLLHIVPYAVTASLLASMVRHWPDEISAFRTVTQQSAQLLMMIAGFCITGFAVFGNAAIEMLYSSNYVEGANAARALVLSEGFIFFGLLAFTGLVATGRHMVYPFITIAGLVFNIVLNILVIPRWSFNGAAATTVVTEGLVTLLLWHQLLRIPGLRPLGFLNIGPIFVASIISGGAGWAAWQIIPWIPAAVVTALVFVGVLTVSGVGGDRGLRGLVGESLTGSPS